MSALLAVATAIVLIIWGVVRKQKTAETAKPVFVKRYIHPGHTWMSVTEDGDVLVGVDDFAQSLIGTIDAVELPGLLKRLEQGGVAWHIRHHKRVVPMVSPVSGRVIERNEMVLRDPMLINTSPYGDGWLLRVRPKRLRAQLNNLFAGKTAHQWIELAKLQLNRLFSGTPALMYQDGGVMLHNLADRCSDDEWKRVAKEFFLADVNEEDHVSPAGQIFQNERACQS
jgi:glycine cleavage system H protein